jgi:hypothetical protein
MDELRPAIGGGVRDREAADEAVLPVDARVVFVAEGGELHEDAKGRGCPPDHVQDFSRCRHAPSALH